MLVFRSPWSFGGRLLRFLAMMPMAGMITERFHRENLRFLKIPRSHSPTPAQNVLDLSDPFEPAVLLVLGVLGPSYIPNGHE